MNMDKFQQTYYHILNNFCRTGAITNCSSKFNITKIARQHERYLAILPNSNTSCLISDIQLLDSLYS